jgi:hypothetical protein
MKFSFKKITAFASTALMAMGVVAAASYPAPFVSGSTADVAIVYGTGVGVDSSDFVQATSIQTDLAGSYTGGEGVSTVVSGDSYAFESETTSMHLGDTLDTAGDLSLDEDDLGEILADGVYLDDDNEECDYEQTIEMADLQVVFFENSEYAKYEPTIGIEIDDNAAVLNYTLEFTDTPEYAKMETTDITMMGREYYVLDADNDSGFTLLDSASSTVVTEGESKTVEGKSVSITYISSSEVALTVDTEETNSLGEGDTQKLTDGSYIGIKDIRYQEKEGTISSVEISIGSGKLVLTNNEEVEMNDEDVDNLNVYIVNDGADRVDTITLEWLAEDELFVTADSEISLPGFESIKLSYGGIDYPAEEVLTVEGGTDLITIGDLATKDNVEDLDVAQFNESDKTVITMGDDPLSKLITSDAESVIFDADTDFILVGTYNDGNDAETYFIKADDFRSENDGADNYTDISYRKDGDWEKDKDDAEEGDEITIGSLELIVGEVNDDEETVNLTLGDSSKMNFDTIVTEEGLLIYLPVEGTGAGYLNTSVDTSFDIVFSEEDEDGDLAEGENITVTVGTNADNETEVTGVSLTAGAGEEEIDKTDIYQNFMYSALATEVLRDISGDHESVEIKYHGSESAVKVYITSADVTLAKGGDGLGEVVVKDSEVSSVSGKNLIVVGGSCINSVAATIVGGSYCGAAFTSATGVGTGQFLIQSVESPYDSSKVATLVAGYEAADTVAAATYLTTQDVDTSEGKKYVGTGATSAELVVE